MAACTIERTGTRIRVILQAQLTAAEVPEVQAALKQELEQGAREVVFDFTLTMVLDSSGIGLLVAACNSLVKTQGAISVINVSYDIMQLLQSMRLIKRLNVSGQAKKEEY